MLDPTFKQRNFKKTNVRDPKNNETIGQKKTHKKAFKKNIKTINNTAKKQKMKDSGRGGGGGAWGGGRRKCSDPHIYVFFVLLMVFMFFMFFVFLCFFVFLMVSLLFGSRTLVFLRFLCFLAPGHWFSYGYIGFELSNVGFPQVILALGSQTLVFSRLYLFWALQRTVGPPMSTPRP